LYVHNVNTVKLTKNTEFHYRLKHVEVRYYFARECYQDGDIGEEHIDELRQLENLLAKPFDRMRFEGIRNDMGV
jgi:uncharacterized protein YaaW (UPF0174 family)